MVDTHLSKLRDVSAARLKDALLSDDVCEM